jgi:hypothetical protein
MLAYQAEIVRASAMGGAVVIDIPADQRPQWRGIRRCCSGGADRRDRCVCRRSFAAMFDRGFVSRMYAPDRIKPNMSSKNAPPAAEPTDRRRSLFSPCGPRWLSRPAIAAGGPLRVGSAQDLGRAGREFSIGSDEVERLPAEVDEPHSVPHGPRVVRRDTLAAEVSTSC